MLNNSGEAVEEEKEHSWEGLVPSGRATLQGISALHTHLRPAASPLPASIFSSVEQA